MAYNKAKEEYKWKLIAEAKKVCGTDLEASAVWMKQQLLHMTPTDVFIFHGVKLTEMHLDDWTIASLLGHKKVSNVKHYRKISNQQMADETREIRQMMSDIIYASLTGWGEEYEQIRQDD